MKIGLTRRLWLESCPRGISKGYLRDINFLSDRIGFRTRGNLLIISGAPFIHSSIRGQVSRPGNHKIHFLQSGQSIRIVQAKPSDQANS